MTGIIHFETFLLTGILLNLTPGNDTIFILSRSIAQGRKAGIISALGIGAGSIIHTLLAAWGLSVVIAQSPVLFQVIKYLGAAYLLYIGYKMLVDRAGLHTETQEMKGSINYGQIFKDAMLTNILNPKVAMFFIAFLPQFIDPNYSQTVVPFLLLGATFVTTGTIWCLILAIFSAAIFSKLKSNRPATTMLNKVCGAAMIALGIKVALFDNK